MKRLKLLLLGAQGQVGWELAQLLPSMFDVVACARGDVDLMDLISLRHLLDQHKPDIIVNAAAFTAVDQAEIDSETAYRINADVVDVLAEYAALSGVWLIHYSTDYVFDGEKSGPYIETDPPHPLNVYGQSKLAGERAIEKHQGFYLILRCSWVYSTRRSNFPLSILKKAREEESLRVVTDSLGAPTSAQWIADVTLSILKQLAATSWSKKDSGIYHVAAGGQTSWYDYAKFLVEQMQQRGVSLTLRSEHIEPITRQELMSLAPRPLNSQFNVNKLIQRWGILIPHWQEQLECWMDAILTQSRS